MKFKLNGTRVRLFSAIIRDLLQLVIEYFPHGQEQYDDHWYDSEDYR